MPQRSQASGAAHEIVARCVVCDSEDLTRTEIDTRRAEPPSRTAETCRRCGFTSLSRVVETLANRTPGERHGSADRPGRDFAMALLAASLVDRVHQEVLLWEPGVSADLTRIARIPLVRSITIATEGSVGAPEAHRLRSMRDLGTDTARYDVVVGNEVVQMLRSPVDELTLMLRAAGPNGLVVLSTDLYDGSDLSRLAFPRNMGHRWYWSARSLMIVAEAAGFAIDVRMPEIAVRKKYLRKRYVFASQDPDVMSRVRRRFGSQLHAPSEASA